MVKWTVTSGTAQRRFEQAVVALGAEPSVNALAGVMVEVSANLPPDYEQAIRELLQEGIAPSTLTIDLIEARRDLNSGTQGPD